MHINMTKKMTKKIAVLGSTSLALILSFALIQAPSALGQPQAGAPKGGFNRAPDPRVQQRTYHFADTNQEMPYALFVSSKVSKNKKNPLIVALHGYGGDGNSLLRGNALDLAEEGGYILVGPMGYNTQGWYGSPVIQWAPAAAARDQAQARDRAGGPAKARRCATHARSSQPRGTERKGRMNVLAMMRKEFNVDQHRTYLMGHSMGGAGALFLGVKYVD